MATYAELHSLRSDSDLGNKIKVAIAIKAHAILGENSPDAGPNRKAWAEVALANPESVLDQLFNYVLAENSAAAVGAISGASDVSIQSNVDDAVDSIVPGGA
jgi:hypothetical protein